jgi:hypothetical protein
VVVVFILGLGGFFDLNGARMPGGWVCNWRQIEAWEWYMTPNMAHLFQHLIRRANHEPKRWQGQLIERGQLITGQHTLAKDTGLSRQEIRTCLERLKSTSEITIQATNRCSIITIVKYKDYQDLHVDSNQQSNQQANQQATSKQPASNQQATTNNNCNKETTEQRKKQTKKRASPFVPPTVEEVEQYCKDKGYEVNAKQFIEYYAVAKWHDAKGNPVKSWKQKIISVWGTKNGRTTENRRNTENSTPADFIR